MGIFSTTETLIHTCPLPPSTSLSTAIGALQNHRWLLHLDPEMESYTPYSLPSSTAGSPPALTKSYRVINNMPEIPKYIHDAKVTIDIQITDVEGGVDILVHPPLGIVQKGQWRVVGDEGEGTLKLNIKTEISCSRVLMGIAKGKAEGNHPLASKAYLQLLDEGQGQSV